MKRYIEDEQLIIIHIEVRKVIMFVENKKVDGISGMVSKLMKHHTDKVWRVPPIPENNLR